MRGMVVTLKKLKKMFSRKSSFKPIGKWEDAHFQYWVCNCPVCKSPFNNSFYVYLSLNLKRFFIVCRKCNNTYELKRRR